MDDHQPRTEPLGNFPFPERDGGPQSRQLVWIRNHANYLAPRGLLDYFRAASIMLRGVVVNFLIGLPYLVVVALVVAALSVNGWGFPGTTILLGVLVVWMILSPIVTRLWNVSRLSQTLLAGTTSSVKTRDRYERSFGGLLIAIVVVGSIEGLAFLLDDFHFWAREHRWGWPEVASIGTVSFGLFAAAGRILPRLAGAKRGVLLLVVGLLGLLLPVVLVLSMADFLAFGDVSTGLTEAVLIAGSLLYLFMLAGFLVVLYTGAFGAKGTAGALVLLVLGIGAFAVAARFDDDVLVTGSKLDTDLTVLSLESRRGAQSVVSSVADQPPVELARLAEHLEDLHQFRAEFSEVDEVRALPQDPSPSTPAMEDADALEASLTALASEASLLPSVIDLVDSIRHDLDLELVDVELFDVMAGELDQLALRIAIMGPLLSERVLETQPDGSPGFGAPGVSTTALVAEVIRLPLWPAADVGVELDAEFGPGWELTFEAAAMAEDGQAMIDKGEELVAEGEDLVLEGQAQVSEGERLLNIDGEDEEGQERLFAGEATIFEGEETQFLGEAMLFWGEDLMYRSEELMYKGDELRSGSGDLIYGTSNRDYSPLNFPLLRHQHYPQLAERYPLELVWVSDDLESLEFDLLEAREEIARGVVFSSRSEVLQAQSGVDQIRRDSLRSGAIFALMLAVLVWVYGWLALDPNRTSLLGMYRDRLAAAFLIGEDTKGDVDVEADLNLEELSRHEAGSTAPYHLINAALNLQGSKEISVQDRKSDYFIFSKRFIGSEQTGYCRSQTMERAFPEMSLSTAMAISGAAASPNMGRTTHPALVAFMAMLNIRLGFWIPNPGALETKLGPRPKPRSVTSSVAPSDGPWWRRWWPGRDRGPMGFSSEEVVEAERKELEERWRQYEGGSERSVKHGLFGVAFSGGGIRSATLNLGITQAFHKAGAFDHVDYMSTVSGGGYLGSSISSAMRSRQPVRSPVRGIPSVRTTDTGCQIVTITPKPRRVSGGKQGEKASPPPEQLEFSSKAHLNITVGKTVREGQKLLKMGAPDVIGLSVYVPGEDEDDEEAVPDERSWWHPRSGRGSFGHQFSWRVRPAGLLRELTGKLSERSRSVNVSDGGHIENLAVIELLRRRCKYIVVGDGGMDPDHTFGALTVLIREARVELNVDIEEIDLDPLRLRATHTGRGQDGPGQGGDGRDRPGQAGDDHDGPGPDSLADVPANERFCERSWAIGRINYHDGNPGYLLYLKSSLTGHEDEDIRGYRAKNPLFPHQSTADQFFDHGQFESYRRLGLHIAGQVLPEIAPDDQMSFTDVQEWFRELAREAGLEHVDAETPS